MKGNWSIITCHGIKIKFTLVSSALDTDPNGCVCLTATVVLFTAGLFGPHFSNSRLLLEIHDIGEEYMLKERCCR